MNLFSLRAVTLAALFLILSYDLFAQFSEYPVWFLYPKKFPNLSVGYTYGFNSSKQDAAITKAAFSFCRVSGVLTYVNRENTFLPYRETDYAYYFAPSDFNEALKSFVSGDSVSTSVIKNQYIGCFSSDPKTVIPKESVKIDKLSKPDWTEHLTVKDENYKYGIGIYTGTGNENDAWKTAEERAIFKILLDNEIEIKTAKQVIVDSKTNADHLLGVTSIKIDYILKGIEILERYPDKSSKIYYVLIRIPHSGIIKAKDE